MNVILLHPTDTLFFKDGRPMTGSLQGHTQSWPMPDTINHGILAALHRAKFSGLHRHRHASTENRNRILGSTLTVGPYPVSQNQWYFCRPLDAQQFDSTAVTHMPVDLIQMRYHVVCHSLSAPFVYPVANMRVPQKENHAQHWITSAGFEAYLKDVAINGNHYFLRDSDIADIESSVGIAISDSNRITGKEDAEGKIYSAQHLRLRDNIQMGVLASAIDKEFHTNDSPDLIHALLQKKPPTIIVGGQQRSCTAERYDTAGKLPLPVGLWKKEDFKQLPNGKFAVKWVLLSPAIWPAIEEGKSKRRTESPVIVKKHRGGSLPNWVDENNGQVMLRMISKEERARRRRLNYDGKGYANDHTSEVISAKLVAGLFTKPTVVSGWSLGESEGSSPGAKPTHLAVPAGSVYYFEADSADDAAKLASVLNWHQGNAQSSQIKNRRSTLLGEKGYGIGVCGTWSFYHNNY